MTSDLDLVAASLRRAAETATPIGRVRHRLNGSVDAAYEVQRINTQVRLAAGDRLVGHKIGLTSPQVQRQLGVEQPDFGALFASMQLADGDTVPLRGALQPRVEVEVAMVLGAPIESTTATAAEVAAVVDHLLPAIEVVASRIAQWDIDIVDTVADNASSGMFVLGGTPVDPASVDLPAVAMTMRCNGVVASTGTGAACLGDPYNAAAWLARRMAELGEPLQPGEIILTGALGPMVDLAPGDRVEAEIIGIGTVTTSRERADP